MKQAGASQLGGRGCKSVGAFAKSCASDSDVRAVGDAGCVALLSLMPGLGLPARFGPAR